VVPPGEEGVPAPRPPLNDELFVILSGEATLRFQAPSIPGCVRRCHRLPGGRRRPRLTSCQHLREHLRYLSISSLDLPMAEYPDSGQKFGVYSVTAAEATPPGGGWSFSGGTASGVDYFDGEG